MLKASEKTIHKALRIHKTLDNKAKHFFFPPLFFNQNYTLVFIAFCCPTTSNQYWRVVYTRAVIKRNKNYKTYKVGLQIWMRWVHTCEKLI